MPNIIEQQPKFELLPVGQDIIFAVSNMTIVAQQLKVKFVAEVHISSGTPPNLNTSTNLIGTFKTTPNNKGVGIFNFSNIVENYVKADNMSLEPAEYKGASAEVIPFPIHLVDKYSRNTNNVRYLAIQFKIEYIGATDCSNEQNDNVVREACGEEVNTDTFTLFNGYLKETDLLEYGGNANQNFGWNWMTDFFLDNNTKKFLTNAPTTQSANLEDYGTLAFIYPETLSPVTSIDRVDLWYYDSNGGYLNAESIMRTWDNGAFNTFNSQTSYQLLYFGCFPANLRGDGTTMFAGLVAAGTIQGGHYIVRIQDAGSYRAQDYRINVNCPDGRGYEPIRLCWLNQYGVWDYFTFNKKSTRSISTKGSTYNQLAGTWNESTYRVDSYKGGKKSFRVNATEKIKINTDFLNEDHNTMFEELMNSPEVYILDGFQTDAANSALNQYVTPVRIESKNFTTKTVANDKLIQYTFEVEKTKTLRTQSV
jgi:hypothetical protein